MSETGAGQNLEVGSILIKKKIPQVILMNSLRPHPTAKATIPVPVEITGLDLVFNLWNA